ncbi:hypothetical protein [Ruegeria lacuscaerulensis]|uniref:hypothetical protein n=1 Tax=Ruegeria lacuscaerulensis TaxID=55218 RepID=UPI00147B9B25|nr:hypothetical protein [Ruegeria lacuscaerulensis]
MNLCFDQDSVLFERNPAGRPDTRRHTVREVMMGDIVTTPSDTARLSLDVRAPKGIERIEVRNGKQVFKTLRPYAEPDLGNRIRVLWSGAEYRGRGRNTTWNGLATLSEASITRFVTINKWNPDSLLQQRNSDQVIWRTITTGNYMGFDIQTDGYAGDLKITTNHGDIVMPFAEIQLEDQRLDAGGQERQIKMFRLLDASLARRISHEMEVDLHQHGDNQIWIAVYTEDGYQAWSSPIYVCRD